MRPRIKICCIASVDEACTAIAAGADALGLVAEMPSGPGPIPDDLIAQIAGAIPPPVATFLLTSRTDPDGVVAHVRACRTNTVQLVDAVPLSVYRALRRDCPAVRIVQVLHVLGDVTVEEAREAAPNVDALLLDSGRPDLPVKQLGGTGRVHDWATSARIVAAVDTPVFLAGGLKPDNVRDAIAQVRPFGLDLCSGVRTDGRLDPAKLAAFMTAAGA